jgi:malonyl-CoA O-methyltransferase
MLDKRSLRSAFARAADTYDAAAALQRRIADELVERLAMVKHRPQSILDLGSGTGYAARLLARRYRDARVVGLDLAEAMARTARRRRGWFRRRGQFVCADAERLPFANASFDLVASSLTLQWCDPAAVFAEVLRVLKPGGLWVYATFGPDTLKELRAAWQVVDTGVHVHEFIDMHDLGDALLGSGFADPVLDVERLVLSYPDVRALLRGLKQLGAHNADRSRARGLTGKRHFRQFEAAYQAFLRDGQVPATYEVVFGHAWAPQAARLGAGTLASVPISALRRRT